MKSTEIRTLKTLTSIETNPQLTQRLLAEQLGVALGTINNTLQGLTQKNWMVIDPRQGKTTYELTSAGMAEKLRLLRLQLEETVNVYAELRAQISTRIDTLDQRRSRLILYGAGRIAQITYVVLANRDLKLVGVVDDERAGQKFFEHDVAQPLDLSGGLFRENPFDAIVLASHSRSRRMKEILERMKLSSSRILALFD